MLTKIDSQLSEYDARVGSSLQMISCDPQGRIPVQDLEKALAVIKHKPDDEIGHAVIQKLTPKSSGEYVSASSTSSYARSITSSNFTLSSTTDGSSASSALFEQQKSGESGTSAFAAQLKKLYRSMCTLEAALSKDDSKDTQDEARITLKRPNDAIDNDAEKAEKERWAKFRADHKQ